MIERPQSTWKRNSLVLLPTAVFALLVLLPTIHFFAGSLSPGTGLDLTRDMLRDGHLQRAFMHTLVVALFACGLASVIAIPAAFVAIRTGGTVRLLVQALGFLPLTMPPYLTAAVLDHLIGILAIPLPMVPLGGLGLQPGDIALVVVFALHYLPFILFSLIAGLLRIDRSVEESALSLGGGRLLVWRRITLPLLTPAYGFGAALVVLRIFEDIGTPLLLGIDDMLAPQLLTRLGSAGPSDPQLIAGALILLGASIIVAVLAWSTLTRMPVTCAPDPRLGPLRWRGWSARLLFAPPLLLVLGTLALAPHLWLLLMALGADGSGGGLLTALAPNRLSAVLGDSLAGLDTTLIIGAGAGILTLVIGGAFGSQAWRPGPAGHLTRFLATSLFAIPGLVLALAYLDIREGWDITADPTQFGWLALMLVVALKQLPLAERLIASRLRVLPPDDLTSALGLGTTKPLWSLPALAAPLAAAFLLGCAAATVELSAALVLIQDPQSPLARDVFLALRTPADHAGGPAPGLLLVGLTAGLLLLLFWLLRQYCRWSASPYPPIPDAARNHP